MLSPTLEKTVVTIWTWFCVCAVYIGKLLKKRCPFNSIHCMTKPTVFAFCTPVHKIIDTHCFCGSRLCHWMSIDASFFIGTINTISA